MDIHVNFFYYTFSLFQIFNYDFIVYTSFTHIATLRK